MKSFVLVFEIGSDVFYALKIILVLNHEVKPSQICFLSLTFEVLPDPPSDTFLAKFIVLKFRKDNVI